MTWPVQKLEQVALPQKGSIVSGPFGSNIGSRFFVDEGVPVIRGNNLSFGKRKFFDDGFVYLTEEKAQEFHNCNALKGDLVFTAAGTIGQVGIIPANARFERYIISNKQLRVRCDLSKVDPTFLFLWFSTDEMRQHIIGKNTGSSIPLINLTILRGLPVPVPPLDMQRRIASKIAAYDDLIENNQRRIQLLEEAARRLYREWFVALRFPGHERVQVVDGVPQGWKQATLGDALQLQRGFDLPSGARKEGTVPIIASTGVTGFHDEARVCGPGVVTGRSGTLGAVHFVHEDFWPLNTSLWVKEFRRVTPLVAYFMLQELGLSQFNSGASVPTLDRKVVHPMPAVIPPTQVQASFEAVAAPMFSQARTLKQAADKARAARDALLPRLMSGALAV